MEFFAGFRKNLRAHLGDRKTGLHAHCSGMAILFALPFGYSFPHSLVFCPIVLLMFYFVKSTNASFSILIENAFGLDKYIWFIALKQGFHEWLCSFLLY